MSEERTTALSGLTDARRIAEDVKQKFPTIDHAKVLHWAHKFTREIAAGQDVQQSFYLNLLRMTEAKRAEIKSIHAYAWIAIRNEAGKWCREHRPKHHESLELAVECEDNSRDFTSKIADEDEVEYMLNQIPEHCREAYVYYTAAEFTAKEVAEHMGLTENEVRKRLKLAGAYLGKARNAILEGKADSTSSKPGPNKSSISKERPNGKR